MNRCKLNFLFMSALFLLISSCSNHSSQYGIATIKVQEGKEIYFKREARGLSYDVLTISANKNLCLEPDPESDYIFHAFGPRKIFYKLENDSLVLYVSQAAAVPQKNDFPVKIIQHEMPPLEFIDLEKEYQKRGLESLEVKLDESLKCK